MKRLFFFIAGIIAFSIAATSLHSQMRVSYMLPDIAAPGMNVYMEFIAPHDADGNFGADATYFNTPTDILKITYVNPDDANKVTFGPLVVSWQGRIISTQVFVNPFLNPNSWDWSLLSNEFVIPIRINRNGVLSNIVNLYIVQPFAFGDRSGNAERILGAGTLGKRSPRGAMIVDEMILANDTYYVSTDDCDPMTPGNQGYLPFILLAKGDISGGTNTTINVSGGLQGNKTRIQDAGPGGGGGGGRFFDAGFPCNNSQNGQDGGDGFTGGGAGGRNNGGLGLIGVENDYRSPGFGTYEISGVRGYSLNEVPPSITVAYEASGGGTGHPFGSSGFPCDWGDGCFHPGQYGGGSGYRQNRPGGSGGNATEGGGEDNSGGKAVGNTMVIPFSGGSGGASGNPQSGCSHSGSGGGGGGAILIFARNINNVAIAAQGAVGQNGNSNSNGGGGSGGSIITAAKLSMNNYNGSSQSIFIDGGKAGGGTTQYGGWGRIRRDAPSWNVNIGAPPIADVYYQGPSSDTTRYFKPDKPFFIGGTKRPSDSLIIMLKAESGDWQQHTVIPTGSPFWNLQLTLPKTDSLYYLVVLQSVANPNKSDNYYAEPDYILSQAAANILIMENLPEIAGIDTVFVDSLLACDGQEKRFFAKIYNIGDADLILQNSSFANGFLTLATPINNLVIPPQDSTELEFIYTYNPLHPLEFVDSLFIIHNDVFYDRPMPWIIRFEMKINPIAIQNNLYSVAIGSEKQVFMPNIKHYVVEMCLGETAQLKLALENNSQVAVNFERIETSSSIVSHLIAGDRQMLPNDTSTYFVEYTAQAIGNYSAMLYFYLEECDNPIDSLSLLFTTHRTVLDFLDNGDFPETRVGQYNEKTIRLRNNGTRQALIQNIANPGNGFSIISVTPALPLLLEPNQDISLLVRFAPQVSGDPITSLLRVTAVYTDSTCAANAELQLSGTAVEAQVLLSKYEIDFGTLYSCTEAQDTVYVINPATSTIPVMFTQAAEITGDAAFRIAYQEPMPVSIQPGDSSMIIVVYDTDNPGNSVAQLHVFTDDISTPDLYAQIFGERDEFDISIVPEPIDLGDVPLGFEVQRTIRVTNNGILPLNLLNIEFDKTTIIGSFAPTSGLLAENGGFIDIDVNIMINNDVSSIERFNLEFAECSRGSVGLINHTKLLAEVSTNSPVNFGILSGCQESQREIRLSNIGNAEMIINNWQKVGPDASLFSFNGQSINGQNFDIGDTLYPTKSLILYKTFSPEATTNGVKNAQILFDVYMNGKDTTIIVDMVGEKRSLVITMPEELSFDGVVIGTSKQLTLTVQNAGFFDVDLRSIDFPNKYQNIFVVSPDHTGAMLNAGSGSVTFDVGFYPSETIRYDDTLFLHLRYANCDEIVAVAINGIGLPARTISLNLPKLELVSPNETNYAIPIYAQVDTDTLSNFIIDTLEIRWHRSIFYPRSISNGTILYNYIDDETRVVGVQLDNVQIPELDRVFVISELRGDVLLGSQSSSLIEISKVSHSDISRVSTIDTSWGSLSIIVCPEGGDRLLNVVQHSPSIAISPNPVLHSANIELNYIEAGLHRLELYDVLGNRIALLDEWTDGANSNRQRTISADFGSYSSGIYMLKLITPTTYYSKILAITK